MKLERVHITTLVCLSIILLVLLEYIASRELEPYYLFRVGVVAGIIWFIYRTFLSGLWKLKFFRPWFVSVPNIDGAWSGRIVPATPDPEVGRPREPIDVIFLISQNPERVVVSMKGPESVGETLHAALVEEKSDQFSLIVTYLNNPDQAVRLRSDVHFGTARLSIDPPYKKVSTMRGMYWTDRGTKGDITLSRVLS